MAHTFFRCPWTSAKAAAGAGSMGLTISPLYALSFPVPSLKAGAIVGIPKAPGYKEWSGFLNSFPAGNLLFNALAQIHDHDFIGNVLYHRQVMNLMNI